MKRFFPLFLLVFLLLLGNNAYSRSMLDKTPQWMSIQFEASDPYSRTRIAYYLTEETTVNGKQYHKLCSHNGLKETLVGLLREDEGKVYINGFHRLPQFTEDILLYDFNLQEGDKYMPDLSGEEEWFGSMYVTKVSTTILENGEEAKLIELDNGSVEWIEGVGNIRGGIVDHINGPTTGADWMVLACHKKDDISDYRSEYVCKLESRDCCDMQTVSISETLISNANVKIENGDNCFIITFENMSDKQKTIQLIDISGKVLKEVRTTDENYNLDMLSYAAGVYLVQVECGQAKSVVKVMKSDAF